MQKVISAGLSLFLVFSSLLPSYAQGIDSIAFQKNRVPLMSSGFFEAESSWNGAVERALQKAQANRPASAEEIRRAVKALENTTADDEYQTYRSLYLTQVKELCAAALAQQPDKAADIAKQIQSLNQEEEIKKSYQVFIQSDEYNQLSADNEREARTYLAHLAHSAVRIAQQNKKAGLPLIRQEFLTLASIGAASQADKTAAAVLLRADVNDNSKYCKSFGVGTGAGTLLARGLNYVKKGSGDWANGWAEGQMKACQEAIASAVGLGIVGQSGNDVYNQDANAVVDLMDEGYEGPLGAALISAGARTLIAMEADGKLAGFIVRAGQKIPSVGLFGKDFSFLSVHDWVNAATILTGSYADGLSTSYYTTQGRVMGNAWEELASYLILYEGARGKRIVDGVVKSSIFYDKRGNITIRFKPFITGALVAGYQMDTLSSAYVGPQLGADGRTTYIDERPNKNAAKASLQKLGINETAYTAASLYYSGKNDLNAWTQIVTENKLATAYQKNSRNGKLLPSMYIRTSPDEQLLSRKNNQEVAREIGSGADIVLAVFFTGKLAISAVKMGVSGLKTGVKVLRIARLGQVGGSNFSASLQRVIKIARFQKYGAHTASEVMANSIRNTLGIKSVLPAPQVKLLPQVKAATKPKGLTYQPAAGEFKAVPQFNKTQALAKAKVARAQATQSEAALRAREMSAARKEAAIRKTQAKAETSRDMDRRLLEKVDQKAQRQALYEQSDEFLARQATQQARYARQNAFNASVDKWTFGKGSSVLNVLRDRALALNLSLLLNMGSPEAAMAVRGVTPLRALAQTEAVQSFRAPSLAKTFQVNTGTLRATPLPEMPPLQVADPTKMHALSFGKWGIASKGLLPKFSFSIPEYIDLNRLVPGFLRNWKNGVPEFSFFTRNTPAPSTVGARATGGYLYSGLPFFGLQNLRKSLNNKIDAHNQHMLGSKSQRYILYSTSILMGLDIATPVLANLGRAFGLSIADNSLVMLATFLPYTVGSLMSNNLKKWIGPAGTMYLGMGAKLAGLVLGVYGFGLNGQFQPEVDTMMHFYKILGAITLISFGGIFIQSAIPAILTDVSLGVDVRRLEVRNTHTQTWRAIGMLSSFAFPVIATKGLGYDWSYCFALAIPLVIGTTLAFSMAGISNVRRPSASETHVQETVSQSEAVQAAPIPAKQTNTWEKLKHTVKNNEYVRLFAEDPTVKYLLPALLLLNAIEISINNGFLFLLPSLVPDSGLHGLFGMAQYAIPFFAGRLLAPYFLKWFPNHNVSVATVMTLAGGLAAIPFAQGNIYAFTAALLVVELGISTAFSLTFARTARNAATQDRIITLIVASALSCAFGPLLLSKLGTNLMNSGILGENAATTASLIVLPTMLTALCVALLYKMEKIGGTSLRALLKERTAAAITVLKNAILGQKKPGVTEEQAEKAATEIVEESQKQAEQDINKLIPPATNN